MTPSLKRRHITIVIACHNRPETTLRCVESVSKQITSVNPYLYFDYSIRIVDSSDNDATQQNVSEWTKTHPHVKIQFHKTDKSPFWAQAMKIAWNLPDAEKEGDEKTTHWLWLNDDVVLFPNALATLLQTETQNAPEAQITVGSLQSPTSEKFTYGGLSQTTIKHPHPARLRHVPPSNEVTPQKVETFHGNLVLIPNEIRKIVGDIGPYTHAFADTDYGLRATKLGVPIQITPYVGTCEANPDRDTWYKETSWKGRLKNICSAKNLPPKDLWHFLSSHATTLRAAMWWAAPYIKAILGIKPPQQNPPKAVMLWNYPPCHFLSWMEKLCRDNQDLIFLFSSDIDPYEERKQSLTHVRHEIQKTFSKKIKPKHPWGFSFDNLKFHFPVSTIPDLMRLKPAVIISTEMGPRSIQGILYAKLTKTPIVVQLRESETTDLFRGPLRRLTRRIFLPMANLVVANGTSGKRVMEKYGVDPKKIRIIHSGTDTNVFHRAESKPKSEAELKLLFCGEFSAQKGIRKFIKTLDTILKETEFQSKQVRFSLIGKETGSEIIPIPTAPNLTIESHGWIEYKTLQPVYEQHHVFIMPSLADEWGMVVNEAMACGLPVLGCTGSQAVEELVTPHKDAGWTYPPQNQTLMEAAIRSMLRTPIQHITEMGEKTKDIAFGTTDHHVAKTIQDLITELAPK